MKCRTVQKYIPDYVSGTLNDTQARTVEKHIKECPQCNEVYTFFESYLKEAKSIKSVKAPGDFESRLFQRISAKPEKSSIQDRLKTPFPFKIPAEAIGLAAIAIIVFFFWKPYEPAKKTFTEFDRNISEGIEPAVKPAPAEHISKSKKRSSKPQSKSPDASPTDQESIALTDESSQPSIIKDAPKNNIAATKKLKQAEKEADVLPAALPKTVIFNLTLKDNTQLKENLSDDQPAYESVDKPKKKEFLLRQSAPVNRETGMPVTSTNDADDSVIQTVKKSGGTVIETVKHNRGVMMYYIIEIPSSQYEFFHKEISKLGTLTKPSDSTPNLKSTKIRIRINLQ